MDKLLRIDMAAEGGPRVSTAPPRNYDGLGGRAMTSAIVSREVPPGAHPLSAENRLVVAPGILAGTSAVMSGRVSVGCKSPLTSGIKEANAGGEVADALARLGYAAIVLEGRPAADELFTIAISKDGVSIRSAEDLRGRGTYETVERLRAEYGDQIAVMCIGPAGEMKLAAASIACTDTELHPTRHAGRGGVGAVMGSKGVKAIVLLPAGTRRRRPKDTEKFQAANKAFADGLRRHPVTGEALPAYGTNVLANIINEAGGYPTRNFHDGTFAGTSKISGETQAALEDERGGLSTHGCFSRCVIRCSGIFVDADGAYVTKQPEYETVWAHGADCGIDDLDVIAQLDRLDDDIGLDTIEMGATIGVAMEGGLLDFGDGQAAMELLRQVGKGTPLGRIIGSGAAVTGKVFGVEHVPVVKGQSMPAYDPRAIQGIGVTYATSPMGADHTAGYAIATNILKVGGFVDPLKPEGQADLSRGLQVATAAVDASGMCLFIAFAILDQPETFQALMDLIGAMKGTSFTADDFTALGRSVLAMEHDFNMKAGLGAADDRLPGFMSREPLPPHGLTFQVTDAELDSVLTW